MGRNHLEVFGRLAVCLLGMISCVAIPAKGQFAPSGYTPVPLVRAGNPVQWRFVFKPNSAAFPDAQRN